MYNQRALNVSSAAVQCRSLTPSFILFLDLGFSLYSIYTSVAINHVPLILADYAPLINHGNRVMSLVSFAKLQSKFLLIYFISK